MKPYSFEEPTYQGPLGMGRAMLLTRQGKSLLPPQWRPNMVPTTVRGKETKSQMANILKMVDRCSALVVS